MCQPHVWRALKAAMLLTSVVLPASGCEMMAKLRLRTTSCFSCFSSCSASSACGRRADAHVMTSRYLCAAPQHDVLVRPGCRAELSLSTLCHLYLSVGRGLADRLSLLLNLLHLLWLCYLRNVLNDNLFLH